LKVKARYSAEPEDKRQFTDAFDRFYSRFARLYDWAVKLTPWWRRWLRQALPHIAGPRVLEVSFGTGWLLTQYAARFETHGIDLNEAMVAVARRNLERGGAVAALRRGNVESLPYPDDAFDTVVNTMSFSGYPDGTRAMAELSRVVRPGGRVVLIDVGYPGDGNRLGTAIANLWKRTGDLIRDMDRLFGKFGFDVVDREIGGWGSVHLYVAIERAQSAGADSP
jgi:ubiquinone/menaquinone biosynthesis C-methylase UbiE